jgi:hypothetical protein
MLLVGAAKLSVVVVDVTAELSITCPNPADNEPQGNCEGNVLEKELLQNEKYQHQVPLLPGILRNVKYALGGGRKSMKLILLHLSEEEGWKVLVGVIPVRNE